MKTIARCTFLLITILGFSRSAQGDGKFFAERVPTDIPYQRALIIFNNNLETLVLQSKYEISQSAAVDSLGWIVPVPAVPEIASANAEAAKMFFFFISLRTRPKVTRISSFIFPIAAIFFLVFMIFFLVHFMMYPFLNKMRLSKVVWRKELWYCLVICLLAFVLMVITTPHLGREGGIEIVKAEKVGIYDVKVIRSENAEAILDWLKENGFDFSNNDVQVFGDYVDKGWCFVVAKIEAEPGTEERKIVSEGMVAPLILQFETDKAVYPLALTSTIGTDTEVLLYTLSDSKLSCNERLTLRGARSTKPKNLLKNLLIGMEQEARALFTDTPESMILCKFKKRLKPKEMKQDIVFEFAPDNDPYVETKIVW